MVDKILKAADDILIALGSDQHWLSADRRAVVKILKELVEEKFASTNVRQSMAALDIVKLLAAWCEKYPESSTSPWSGIEEFREIERAAILKVARGEK